MTGQPQQDPRQPPPGWYSDPGGRPELRWWDGSAWSEHIRPPSGPLRPDAQEPRQPSFTPAPQQVPQPVPDPAPAPRSRARKSWPRRHKVLTGTGALAVVIIAVVATNSGHKASPSAASGAVAVAASASAPSAPAPSSSGPAPATRIEFIVSGSAPDGIDITYGPSGSDLSGPSSLDGTAKMSVPFDASADYYALSAQLQGGGDITCKIVATGPGDAPLTVSSGAASGSYNICSAQATSGDGISWQNEN